MRFQTCMTFFWLKSKDSLKKCFESIEIGQNNLFFPVPHIQVWYDMMVSKWWHNFMFWVNYHFKLHQSSPLQSCLYFLWMFNFICHCISWYANLLVLMHASTHCLFKMLASNVLQLGFGYHEALKSYNMMLKICGRPYCFFDCRCWEAGWPI